MPIKWDLIITNGLVFDGTGEAPEIRDIAIKDGTIAVIEMELDPRQARQTIEARGHWVMPGLVAARHNNGCDV